MERIWTILTPDPRDVTAICRMLKCSRVMAAILANRNITSPKDLPLFFDDSLKGISMPFNLKDMDIAVERIAQAVFSREKIMIFGDYDVDGITGTAVLYEFLTTIGAEVSCHIPHRIKEGYGLKPGHIRDVAIPKQIQLIITVDCGSASHRAVDDANAAGIDVVITDHHTIPDDPPKAVAVINPKRHDCDAGLDYLAGVGVAFYLVIALRMHLRYRNFWVNQPEPEPNLKAVCDLVALGTVADMVPLTGENRILVKQGLGILKKNDRAGVKALFNAIGISGEDIDSQDISFRIGPRLNAAGRMSHAEIALALLTTKDMMAAEKIAGDLCRLNQNRQIIEKEILDDIARYMADYPDSARKNLTIVMAHQQWHEGLLGIVAAKIANRYYRPVVLISNRNGIGKGSARSIPGFDLYHALSLCSDDFEAFGGHQMAAGITIKSEKINQFRQNFEETVKTLSNPEDFIPTHLIDVELDFHLITDRLMDELATLQPYGTSNQEPLFMATRVNILSSRVVGDHHLKLQLGQGNGKVLDAIFFNAPPEYYNVKTVDRIAFKLHWNRYNGRQSVQAVVVDME